MIGIALPIQLGLTATDRSPAVRLALSLLIIAIAACLAVLRTRMTKYVSKTLGVTSAEASQVLSRKSWQTSAWQSGPAAALLKLESAPRETPHSSSDTAPTMPLSRKADTTNETTRG